jgi:hypothetical protein
VRRSNRLVRRVLIDSPASLAKSKYLLLGYELIPKKVDQFDAPRLIVFTFHLKTIRILPEVTPSNECL